MRGKPMNTDSREAPIPASTGNGAGRLFAVATTLARKGRYEEAIKLLQKALDAGECSRAEALDLLARIYAQQGRHLDAETCWLEAKRLDESNPTYDDALNRLRRDRRSSGRLGHLATALAVIAFLALLLWQLLLVNPNVYRRQDAAEASLTAMREDIATWQNASQARGLELGTGIAALNRSLMDLDSRLAPQLKALATSVETAKERDAAIARLDQQVATLQQAVEREIGSLAARYEKLNSAQIRETEAVKASIVDLAEALDAVERSLAERYEKRHSAQMKEAEAVRASIVDLAEALDAVEERLSERVAEVELVETAVQSDVSATAADRRPGSRDDEGGRLPQYRRPANLRWPARRLIPRPYGQ